MTAAWPSSPGRDQRLEPVPEVEVPVLLLLLPALSVAPEFDMFVVPEVLEAPDVPEVPEELPEAPDVLPELPPEVPEVLPEPDMPSEPDVPDALPELPDCFFDFDLEFLPVCLSLDEPVPVASWPEPLWPIADVPPVVLPVPVPVPVPLWAKAKLVTVARTAAAIIDLRIVDSW